MLSPTPPPSCAPQVTQLMVPLLKFYFHEEVRRAATSALPQLLRATQAAAEKGVQGASQVRGVEGGWRIDRHKLAVYVACLAPRLS